jgi:hypothetical protein
VLVLVGMVSIVNSAMLERLPVYAALTPAPEECV